MPVLGIWTQAKFNIHVFLSGTVHSKLQYLKRCDSVQSKHFPYIFKMYVFKTLFNIGTLILMRKVGLTNICQYAVKTGF